MCCTHEAAAAQPHHYVALRVSKISNYLTKRRQAASEPTVWPYLDSSLTSASPTTSRSWPFCLWVLTNGSWAQWGWVWVGGAPMGEDFKLLKVSFFSFWPSVSSSDESASCLTFDLQPVTHNTHTPGLWDFFSNHFLHHYSLIRALRWTVPPFIPPLLLFCLSFLPSAHNFFQCLTHKCSARPTWKHLFTARERWTAPWTSLYSSSSSVLFLSPISVSPPSLHPLCLLPPSPHPLLSSRLFTLLFCPAAQ